MTYARIPITNVHADGDYTGCFRIGAAQTPLNLLLDTGSSAFAIDARKYRPDLTRDRPTRLAQQSIYDDQSSWTGAVIKTRVSAGDGAHQITLENANVALAYHASSDMFAGNDGILGLAYSELDDAVALPGFTWPERYTRERVMRTKKERFIRPYLTQLARRRIVSDKVSFYTRRSAVHTGAGGHLDPLNQGFVIIGGGEEATDLYQGAFKTVKVLADEWYCTNLKAIKVGTQTIYLHVRPLGLPSNSIVDSGTTSLDLPKELIAAMISEFSPRQRALLESAIYHERAVSVARLKLADWPSLSLILEGQYTPDVTLRVAPSQYWQVNAPRVGLSTCALGISSDSSATLGLPLMNGYFTIFDGEAARGKGVVKFATRR